jgi:hypothetical protein
MNVPRAELGGRPNPSIEKVSRNASVGSDDAARERWALLSSVEAGEVLGVNVSLIAAAVAL